MPLILLSRNYLSFKPITPFFVLPSPIPFVLCPIYFEDREVITLEDVTDMEGETVPSSDVELRMQTLAKDGNFWMDKGAFTLKIQEN